METLIHHDISGKIAVWRHGTSVLFSDAVVSNNTAHHVALWYDAGTNTSYLMIDGVTQQSSYSGNLLAVTNPVVLMAGYRWYTATHSRMLGEVDEVAVYDTAVDASTFVNRSVPPGSGSTVTDNLTYDANGNRLTLDDGTTVTNFGYQASTNKLTSIGGLTVQRDASGNRVAEVGGTRTYTYNDANRLSGVLDGGVSTATYVHNALGQRTKKTVGGTDVIYLYDLSGNLIAEHDATGALIRDYVWMNGLPVAQIDTGEVFSYLHVDHLGTPRLATNDSQTVVWRWDSDAFGTSLPDEDPDGDGTGTTVNLRFAGQYFDGETGFHYNYFRTYDPSTGRYLESDPIGLLGGANTYGYALANPISLADPLGLDVNIVTTDPTEFKILSEAYARLTSTKKGIEICDALEKSPDIFQIMSTDKDAFFCPLGSIDPKCKGEVNTVFIDPFNNPHLQEAAGLAPASKAAVLGHELAHAAGYRDDGPGKMNNVISNENPIRSALGEPRRTTYSVPAPLIWTPGTK